jgi:hypothetical protein
MEGMEDTSTCFDLDDFPYFQGVDLTLWVQLVLSVLVAVAGGALLWSLAG